MKKLILLLGGHSSFSKDGHDGRVSLTCCNTGYGSGRVTQETVRTH